LHSISLSFEACGVTDQGLKNFCDSLNKTSSLQSVNLKFPK